MSTADGWWVYLLRPTRADILQTGPTDDEARLAGEHWDYTTELHAAGRIALAGRAVGEDPFAVIVVRADDEAAAREVIDREPGVVGGLFTAELQPFELLLSAS